MLNRRRMMMMMSKKESSADVWDYEWVYTPGGEYPPNMTYVAIEDTGSGILVNHPNLLFSDKNGIGDAELFVRGQIVGAYNDPQLIIVHSTKKGFKVYSDGTNLRSNAEGASKVLCLQSTAESIRIKFEGNTASIYINGELVLSGPGVENNAYLSNTGIVSTTSNDNISARIMSLKEIRFRRL